MKTNAIVCGLAALCAVVARPATAQDRAAWMSDARWGVMTHYLADWIARTWQLPLRPNVLGTCVATCERLRADGIRVLVTGEGGDDWLRGSHAHWPDLLRRGMGATSREFTSRVVAAFQLTQPWGSAA